jgi:pantoate--beta-alanine ligase
MKTVKKIKEMKAISEEYRSKRKSIGFVPTMGCLHEGHLSLVKKSVVQSDITVVSVFVNPAQFGPEEDFKEYPRDLKRDLRLLEEEGVDFLFAPSSEEMYPDGYLTYVEVNGLQDRLCGQSRPGFFRGVCTVVLKLFNIVRPDFAYFGQKDAQQAVILRRMAGDLNLDVKIEVLPIMRDTDGLALSSRNSYLDDEQRKAALALSASLNRAAEKIEKGERDSAAIIQSIKKQILAEPLARIDYVEVVDVNSLAPLDKIKERALIALAVYIGKARLIDNIMVKVRE